MPRGIYILPSLITSCNIAIGVMSIISSFNGDFTKAAWMIFICMALDIMDGRVARWTKTTSKFGVELDSLSDLVSFGVAPAILIYFMILKNLGRSGDAIAIFYVITSALRLARFNVTSKDGEFSEHFTGLPVPAGAGILASFVLSYQLFEMGSEVTAKTIPLIMKRMPFFFNVVPLFTVIISLLMISNVPYLGFKTFRFHRPKSLQLLILLVVGILLVITYPQNTIFIVFSLYLFSGAGLYLVRYWRLRRSAGTRDRLRKSGR